MLIPYQIEWTKGKTSHVRILFAFVIVLEPSLVTDDAAVFR
jgi:hypothetical protein